VTTCRLNYSGHMEVSENGDIAKLENSRKNGKGMGGQWI
jgi:hypothetical protein